MDMIYDDIHDTIEEDVYKRQGLIMTKLGMPTINIAFVEKGIEAVERSSRGILAIILEDTAEAIGKLAENPFTIYTTDDIPENLSDDNKDYLTKALIGYVKAP